MRTACLTPNPEAYVDMTVLTRLRQSDLRLA
jgi:hypothetical protein